MTGHDWGPPDVEASAPTCDRETDAGALQGNAENSAGPDGRTGIDWLDALPPDVRDYVWGALIPYATNVFQGAIYYGDNRCDPLAMKANARCYVRRKADYETADLIDDAVVENVVELCYRERLETLSRTEHLAKREHDLWMASTTAFRAHPEMPRTWPEPLDLASLATIEPRLPPFNVAHYMPAGYGVLCSAHGGGGKSTICMHQAVCIALGMPFAGLPTIRRRVLYLSCEDRASLVHWRLAQICRHHGISMADLAGWLHIVDLVGHESILWLHDSKAGATYTSAYAEFERRIRDSGAEVVYVDGISDTFGGNENDRTHAKAFVNALLANIDPDIGSLVLIGHVNKITSQGASVSEGYSGSTGWHNAVRARWFLYPETERDEDRGPVRTGRLILELQKSNLGVADHQIGWRWDDGARMFLPEVQATHFDRKAQESEERMGILRALQACAAADINVPAAMQGPRTAYHVLRERPEMPDSLRSGKPASRRFWREIERFRHIRFISELAYRRTNGHVGSKFVLTTEGERHIATYR